jgi:hypothetical protein
MVGIETPAEIQILQQEMQQTIVPMTKAMDGRLFPITVAMAIAKSRQVAIKAKLQH